MILFKNSTAAEHVDFVSHKNKKNYKILIIINWTKWNSNRFLTSWRGLYIPAKWIGGGATGSQRYVRMPESALAYWYLFYVWCKGTNKMHIV